MQCGILKNTMHQLKKKTFANKTVNIEKKLQIQHSVCKYKK